MHTVKLYEDSGSAADNWFSQLDRPDIVTLLVCNDEDLDVNGLYCRTALLHLTNGTAVHMIASGTETTILPRFDVAWFDGVEPPEWLGDMAKPGAVVLLSRQPTSEKDTA